MAKLTNFSPIEPRWCSLFTFWLAAKLGTLPEGVQPSGRAPSFPLEACKMGEPLAAMVGPSMSQLDHALTNMYRDTMRLIEKMHYHWKHIFMNGCIGILYSWMCMCIAAPRLSGHMMGETWLFLQERDCAKIIFISSFFILCHFSQRYAKMSFLWQHRSGVRYQIWFNSIFEFCQKMIHSLFDSILLYPRFNSKYYSIQRKFCWFNSKNNSIIVAIFFSQTSSLGK